MRNPKIILIAFLLLNLLVSLPLYIWNRELSYLAILTILFYTILWGVLESIHLKVSKIQDEEVLTSFAIFIGLKFLMSIVLIVLLFKLNLFSTIYHAFVIMPIYLIYTFLMLKYNLVKQ